ncbi:LamG-like jellyroll fold domain-containing protein [Mucilaginibacter sp.]
MKNLFRLYFFFSLLFFARIFNSFAQTPPTGTITFQYATGANQIVGSSAYACFVPTTASGYTNDTGVGYEFVTQGTGEAAGGPYLQVGFYTYSGSDGMIYFNRSASGANVSAAYIMSAATGAANSQTATTLPAAGGEFKLSSIDLEEVSSPGTVSIQAYKDGVAIGSAVTTATLSTTTKTTINLASNSSFYDIDEIKITGFNIDGIRADNIVTATAIIPPVITTQPTSVTVCSLSPATFMVAATGTGLTYQWYVNGANFQPDHTDGNGTYSGSQTATLNIAPGPGNYFNGASLYCVVTSSNGSSTTSNTVTLNVNALPNPMFTAPSAVYVNSASTFTLAAAVDPTSTYSYSLADGSIVGGSGTTFQVQFPTVGDKLISLSIKNANGCVATYSLTVTVTLNVTTAGYAFSQPITIKSSAISVGGSGISTTLNNFPVLVYIKEDALSNKYNSSCSNNVQSPTNGNATANNYDFAFTLVGDQKELFYQVESFDATNGILLAWVQVPALTSADQALTFYFGASTPGHTALFSQSTWNTDYQAVYHFNEGTGTTILDATTNGLNGVSNKLTTATGQIQLSAGQTNGGYLFNGTTTSNALSSSIIQNAGTNTNITGTFTLSAWVNSVANPANLYQKVVTNESNLGNGYAMSLHGTSTTTLKVETETRSPAVINNAGTVSTVVSTLSTPAWHYIQSVYDGTNFLNYVDGVLAGTAPGAAPDASNTPLVIGQDYIGSSSAPQHDFYGMMDEVRVSTAVKSADWIKAEYYNQTNPTTFTYSNTAITAYTPNKYAALGASITYVWTGATSTDPANASNWTNTSSAMPSAASIAPPNNSTTTLYIPNLGTSANYPVLTGNLSVFGLVLGSGAKITLGSYTLSVGCNIYNSASGAAQLIGANGTIYSTINWNGITSSPQYLYGSSTTTTNLGNMIVNNTQASNVIISGGAVNLYNTLTMTNGNLVIDNAGSGSLTLKSNASGSATVGQVATNCTSCAITGNVNVERYIDGGTGYRGYRFLSSPVNISGLVNQSGTQANIDLHYLTANMITGGPTGTTGGFTQTTTNPLMYLFDETRPVNHIQYTGGENVGINSIYGNSTTYAITTLQTNVARTVNPQILVPVGNAYLVYYVGNTASGDVLTTVTPHASTVVATGTLNQGTIPVYVTNGVSSSTAMTYTPTAITGAVTPGLHQIGNPYASTIDLKQLYNDNSANITPVFDELQAPNGAYQSYNASSGATSANSAGEYVVSGQGFFVHNMASGNTLTFKEDVKVNKQLLTSNSTNPLILNQKGNAGNITASATLPTGLAGLHLQLNQDSLIYTQTGIYFSPLWSDKYVPNEDAIDLDGTSVYLSSYSSDNHRLSINQLADYSKGKVVKLYVSAASYGNYMLHLADIENIDTLYNVYLRDHYLKDSVNLLQTKSYPLSVTTDTASYGANRFDLVIELKQLPPYQLLTFAGQKVTNGVQLNWLANNAGNYTGFSLQKETTNNTFNTIYNTQSTNASNYSYIDTNPIIGNNMYRLAQTDVLGNITYSQTVTIGYSDVSSNGYFSVYPNPSKDIINILINSTPATAITTYTADIYNTSGTLLDHRILNSNTWTEDISSYKEGVYLITLTNTSGHVLGKTKFIKTE